MRWFAWSLAGLVAGVLFHYYGSVKMKESIGITAQQYSFGEWLRLVEEKAGHVVPSRDAARLYHQGVSVMDAVVALG